LTRRRMSKTSRRRGSVADRGGSAHRIADGVQALVEETERILQTWKHPEPYIPPTAPGGTKYERNLPPPILDRLSSDRLFWHVLTFSSASANGRLIAEGALQIVVKQIESIFSIQISPHRGLNSEWNTVIRIAIE
jgi:hypothetical protein